MNGILFGRDVTFDDEVKTKLISSDVITSMSPTQCMDNIEDVVNVDDDTSICRSCNSNDTNECIELFLGGGISIDDLQQVVDWENNDTDDNDNETTIIDLIDNRKIESDDNVTNIRKDDLVRISSSTTSTPTTIDENDDDNESLLYWFQYAYRTNNNNKTTNRTTGGNSNSGGIIHQQQDQGRECEQLPNIDDDHHCVRISKQQVLYEHQHDGGEEGEGDTMNQSYYYSLIAKYDIPKGTILYTERPLFATQQTFDTMKKIQQPQQHQQNNGTFYHNNNNSDMNTTPTLNEYLTTTIDDDDNDENDIDRMYHYKVRACQYCFQSLEPISSCYNSRRRRRTSCNTNNNNIKNYDISNTASSNVINTNPTNTTTTKTTTTSLSSSSSTLPLPHLYPVPDFCFPSDVSRNNYDDENKHTGTLSSLPSTTTTTSTTNTNTSKKYRTDIYRRIQCITCQSYFCSMYCYNTFLQQYNSCCLLLYVMKLSYHTIMTNSTTTTSSSCCTNNDTTTNINITTSTDTPSSNRINQPNQSYELNQTECNDNHDDDNKNNDDQNHIKHDNIEIPTMLVQVHQEQPAILLAIRMFIATLQSYRTTSTMNETTNTVSTTTSSNSNMIPTFHQYKNMILKGLCGTDTNIQLLELGIPVITTTNNTKTDDVTYIDKINNNNNNNNIDDTRIVMYTLEPIYNHLVIVYNITKQEQQLLNLSYFMSFVSKAARNGFHIRTQSPFQSYYNALVRTSIRGSDQHKHYQRMVATALGCTDGTLYRGIDSMVDEYVCPNIVAMYLLTSRINHSCLPNCQVIGQQYINNIIDVVSICDIKKGDEITISYIHGNTRKRTYQRRNELYAKYLFHCNCSVCK